MAMGLLLWGIWIGSLLLGAIECSQRKEPRITEQPSNVVVRKHEPITLNCQADGNPRPVIEWYHDGQLVRDTPNRMMLPNGQLFFLHVTHSRRDQDTGTYWCVAKNDLGQARSNNATVEVAVLREDFRTVPKSVQVAAGDVATLECTPPRGHPEPVVRWLKDGEPVNVGTGRIRLLGQGDLVISEVRQADEGLYVCTAKNLVGVRETPPVTLSVHVKPYFLRAPEDITSLAEEEVQFQCKVGGDPQPTITWGKQDGKMPIGRALVQADHSLNIKNVAPSDEGVYICEAENTVGVISASATLTVHSKPSFLMTPKDQRVGLNGVATFECIATGNPPPSVFWNREGNQVLMFPGKSHGRFSVSSEGTLKISGVRKEDRGYYVCSALSVVGSTMAKGYLEVTAVADLPPPIIKVGPANQTLPQNTVAILPCEATGLPSPVIKWFFNSAPISTTDPRFIVLNSGTLQIEDLRTSDSGMYSCTASSESGETSWSASLTVESPRNPNVNFHRSPDPSAFPSAPSKPVAISVNDTSVRLKWRKNGKTGASPLIGYTVEYYSSDLQSGWLVAAHRVPFENYTVQALKPESRYIFLVRAENSHGIGPPSDVSDVMRTLRPSTNRLRDFALDEARLKLGLCVVTLKEVRAVSSTSVRLTWEIQGSKEYIEGFYIRFRDLSGGSQKYNMVTVLRTEGSYVLKDLRKFTRYDFFLVPFYKNVEGPPSNSRSVQTLEDVPSAPPDGVHVKVLNLTSAVIYWSPPPPQHRNGVLQGYHVYVSGNLSVLHSNVSTNSTTTTVTLNNLTAGAMYSVQVVAFTSVGGGPLSAPVALRMDGPSSTSMSSIHNIVQQPWFIALIGGLVCLMLSIFFIFVFLKRRMAWKKALGAHLTVPVHKPEDLSTCLQSLTSRTGMNAREALWINRAWRPTEQEKETLSETKLLNKVDCTSNDLNYSSVYSPLQCNVNAPDYAEVDTHNMTTFYKKELPSIPAPYATTTLINPPSQKHYSGSTKDGRSSSSEDASRKSEKAYEMELKKVNEDGVSDHHRPDADRMTSPASDSGSYTTDEYGMPIKKPRLKFPRPSGSKAPVMNWSEIIPPPPEHPPSEAGSPPHTPGALRGASPYTRQLRPQVPPGCMQPPNYSPIPGRGFQPQLGNRLNQPSPRSTLHRGYADPHRVPTPPVRGMVRPPPRPQFNPPSPSHSSVSNPLMDRAIQSSLPSLVSEPHSLPSVIGLQGAHLPAGVQGHIYHPPDLESDVDMTEDPARPRSPDSSVAGDTDYAPSQVVAPSWASTTDHSNSSCTSGRSSGGSSSDGSFYTDADFASAIARAAQNAGFRVDGSVISAQNGGNKNSLPDWLLLPSSPYSTDNEKGKTSSHRTHNKLRRPYPSKDAGEQSQLMLHPSEKLPPSQINQTELQLPGDSTLTMQSEDSKLPSYNKPSFPSIQGCASVGGRRWKEGGLHTGIGSTNSMPSNTASNDYASSKLRAEVSHPYHGST